MAVFMIYSPGSPYDNASGRNAVVAVGASEAAARTAAQAAAPDGETRVHAAWSALQLAAAEHAALTGVGGVVWLQGHGVVEPLRRSRGA